MARGGGFREQQYREKWSNKLAEKEYVVFFSFFLFF